MYSSDVDPDILMNGAVLDKVVLKCEAKEQEEMAATFHDLKRYVWGKNKENVRNYEELMEMIVVKENPESKRNIKFSNIYCFLFISFAPDKISLSLRAVSRGHSIFKLTSLQWKNEWSCGLLSYRVFIITSSTSLGTPLHNLTIKANKLSSEHTF